MIGNSYAGSPRNDIRAISPYGVSQPGSPVQGGGGGVPNPFFRDLGDAKRSMYRRTPEAEYPSGYLGTITSRREDRFLTALKSKLGDRQYQRGVHKGSRIDPTDYEWPKEFNPATGLRLQMEGKKFAPIGVALGVVGPTTESVIPASGARLQQTLDPHRADQMRRLLPTWRY